MNEIKKQEFIADEWLALRAFTQARIALGKTGVSIPLHENLKLKLAHAHATQAVYATLDKNVLLNIFKEKNLETLVVKSKATDRTTYLQRPDLGRALDENSKENLSSTTNSNPDILIVVADGLSANAVNNQASELVIKLVDALKDHQFSIGPTILAEQARVAIADEIGAITKAKLSIILIGERPGLSSFESMSAYLTYDPKNGLTDESRNCISNIRDGGITIKDAVDKIMYLIKAAFAAKLSGVGLKDDDGLALLK